MEAGGSSWRRVVYDSSVWVSAFGFRASVPDRAIDLARRYQVRSLVSDALIDQGEPALLEPRFRRSPAVVRAAVVEMWRVSEIVVPIVRLAVVTAKESDSRVLECAVEGRADVIVTGDRKPLPRLGSYAGIPIVAPADFLRSR